MHSIKNPKFPCRICTKNVHDKDKAVQCDLCKLWIHMKCNNLNYLDYSYLQNCDESWYCIEVAAQFSLSTPYQVTENFWLVVLIPTVTSFSGKI